jgi:hypothetical protein
MRSDTAAPPTISGMPTTVGTAKRLLSDAVVTQNRNTPKTSSQLDAPDWAGTWKW